MGDSTFVTRVRLQNYKDQEPLARTFDIETVQTSPSFEKLRREVRRLIGQALSQAPQI